MKSICILPLVYLVLIAIESQVSNGEDFDMFKLVMQWGPTFCRTKTCNPPVAEAKFGIHGLWPAKELTNRQGQQYARSLQCFATTDRLDPVFEKLKADLLEYWPQLTIDNWNLKKGFWQHEWNKHGSCSSLKKQAYFETAILAAKEARRRVLDALAKNGVGQKYSLKDIKQKLEGAINGYEVNVECYKSQNQDFALYEIHVCLEKVPIKDGELQFKPCPKNYYGFCPGTGNRISLPTV